MILRSIFLTWLQRAREHAWTLDASFSLQRQRNRVHMAMPVVLGEPVLFPMLVVLGVVWLLPHTPLPTHLHTTLNTTYHSLPSVRVDFPTSSSDAAAAAAAAYPPNKTALYLEPRPLPFLIPLLLHMLTIIPPSWPVVFLGSSATTASIRTSHTALRYEQRGKLRIVNIEDGPGSIWGSEVWGRRWDDLGIDEMGSRLLTNLSFYEEVLEEVRWLLVWHSDAILCANSETDLEEWVGWDWVGAPWATGGRFGGNGGLSVRNVERVKTVLRFQKRMDNTHSEDQWLSARLGLLPDANMCPPEKEREFAVADVWHEWPMGYHVNTDSFSGDVWEPHLKRKQIFDYCPEVKIILDMRLEREKCRELPRVDLPLLPGAVMSGVDNGLPLGQSMSVAAAVSDSKIGESGGEGDLETDVKESEDAMAELKKGTATDKTDIETPTVAQELGEPEIADFAHVKDVMVGGDDSGDGITMESHR